MGGRLDELDTLEFMMLLAYVIAFVLSLFSVMSNNCYLHLEHEGFTEKKLFTKNYRRWDEVGEFKVYKFSVYFIPVYKRVRIFKKHNSSRIGKFFNRKYIVGAVTLSDSYGMKPEALIALMKPYQQRAL